MMKKLSLLALAMAVLVPLTLVASADSTDKPAEEARPNFHEEVDRTVTQLENGVQMSITTENPDLVEKIQERAADKQPKHEGVIKEVENLSDGVQVTITSEDPDQVEKIQNHAENPKPHRKGGKKGQGQCEK